MGSPAFTPPILGNPEIDLSESYSETSFDTSAVEGDADLTPPYVLKERKRKDAKRKVRNLGFFTGHHFIS